MKGFKVNGNSQGLLHVVGDTVFYMRDNKVTESEIECIKIFNTVIEYYVNKCKVNQERVFKTKQELLDSL